LFPFDAGLIALIVAVLVLFLTVLIKLEAPTEFGPANTLKKIPKNSTIPDDCFVCPKMVECLLKSVDSQIEHKD